MKIGIVTFEYPGFTKNGGIGTSYGRLAAELLDDGHDVTVFFVDIGNTLTPQHVEFVEASESKDSVSFKIIQMTDSRYSTTPWPVSRSVDVFENVRQYKFDIIHFHDCLGLGWASIKAKKLGLAFQKTRFIMGLHGPNYWVRAAHQNLSSDLNEYLESALEKECFEDVDEIVSPSQYLVDYLGARGWKSKNPVTVLPNVNSTSLPTKSGKMRVAKGPGALIFFGRLEPRKGIHLFVDALKIVAESLPEIEKWEDQKLKVYFLGRDTRLQNGQFAMEMIKSSLAEVSSAFDLKFIGNYDSAQCAKFFKEHRDDLIVMPSLSDNSPYAVVECLEAGLNFVCTNVGGQSELLAAEDIAETTCEPKPQSLAFKILDKLSAEASRPPLPSTRLTQSTEKWLELHRRPAPKDTASAKTPATLSIIIRAESDILALVTSLKSLAENAAGIENVYVYFFSYHISNKDKETLADFKTFFAKLNIHFMIAFGGSYDELLIHAHQHDQADYFMSLQAGDILKPGFLKSLKNTLVENKDAGAFLLGFQSSRGDSFPPPLNTANHLIFDSICKFPMIFRRLQDLSKKDGENYFISYFFGLKAEFLFRLNWTNRRVHSLPFIGISNPQRQQFNEAWIVPLEELDRRLVQLKEFLDQPSIRAIRFFHQKIRSHEQGR